MRFDTNTKGHKQWYYFSAKNKKPIKVTFNIYRFNKPLSLYQRGMKPYILSKKQYQLNKKQWKQQGTKVKYTVQNSQLNKKKYILSFDYQFKHESDEVFFAACPPYSYTYLNQQLKIFQMKLAENLKINKLATTLCGLDIPLLTFQNNLSEIKQKNKYIIIIGRSHPGQTSSSWVMDGLINLFVDQYRESNPCLKNIIIKIIPMMNPDGVFIGNYRTGIIGMDLNRNFNSGKTTYFPEISELKKLIKQIKSTNEIIGFLDIHGHSILKNSFLYGPNLQKFSNNKFSVLPQKLKQKSLFFRLESCRFKYQKEKMQTARVYFQIKQNILSFTLQNSLGLYFDKKNTFAAHVDIWKQFGKQLGESILQILAINNQTPKKNITHYNPVSIQSDLKCNQQKFVQIQSQTLQKEIMGEQKQKTFKQQQFQKLQKQKIKNNQNLNLYEGNKFIHEISSLRKKIYINKESKQKQTNNQMYSTKKTPRFISHRSGYENKQKIYIATIKQKKINNQNQGQNIDFLKKSSKEQDIEKNEYMDNLQDNLEYDDNDQDSDSDDLNEQQKRPVLMVVQNIYQNNEEKSRQVEFIKQNKNQLKNLEVSVQKIKTQSFLQKQQKQDIIISPVVANKFKQIKLEVFNSQQSNSKFYNQKQRKKQKLRERQKEQFNNYYSKIQGSNLAKKYIKNKQTIQSSNNQPQKYHSFILHNSRVLNPSIQSKNFNRSQNMNEYNTLSQRNNKQTKFLSSLKKKKKQINKSNSNLDKQINFQMNNEIQMRMQQLQQIKYAIFNQKAVFEEVQKNQSNRNTLNSFYLPKKI